jgi:hypothetical protein
MFGVFIYRQSSLVFSMESDGFSYEWLLHMGASTKQEQSGKFAGFFIMGTRCLVSLFMKASMRQFMNAVK